MARNAIKGITVEIGGDTVGLQKALGDVNSKANDLRSELRQVENGLKFDPKNTTLLAQKQQILAEQVKNTSEKFNTLKSVQAQVEQQYKEGKIPEEAYRAFQRELETTRNKLENLKEEQKNYKKSSDDSKASTEKLEKAFNSAKNVASSFGSAMGTVAKGVGTVMAATSTAVLAAGTAATSVGKEFESSMSQVAATMGTSVDKISGLEEKAKELGATTQFSATEAAQGLNILAQSGLTAEEQTAAIESVLDLAAAGTLDMGSAASYTTGAVKGFGDTMDNAQYYTDLMAKGATLANTDVNSLGDALSGAAATANSYGQNADGVTLSLLRLAEQNSTGQEAATSLKRAMADLYTPTDAAKSALDELGIATYDSSGNTRDFNTIIDELNGKLSNLTDEQANAYKNTIFTTNGLNAFNKMTASSTDKVAQFKEELAKASEGEGSAAEQAKTMIDNLEGDITLFQSAVSSLGIEFYDTFNGQLREAVQGATGYITDLTNAFKEGGLSQAADVAGGIIADIATKAADFIPTLVDTASTLIDSVASALTENSSSIVESGGRLIQSLASGIAGNTSTILNAVTEIGGSLLEELPNMISGLVSSASSFAQSIINFFNKSVSIVAKELPSIFSSLFENLATELPKFTATIFRLIQNVVNSILELLPQILPDFITSIVDITVELIPQIINTVLLITDAIVENVPTIVNVLVKALPDLIQRILNSLLTQVPKILNTVIVLVSSLVDALPQIIDTIVEVIPQIIDAIIKAYTAYLPKLINAGTNLLTSIIEDLPTIINTIVDALPQIIDAVILGITSALPQIIECGVELFLALIENLPTIIEEIVKALPQIIEGIVTGLIELIPRLVTCGGDIFYSIVNDLPQIVERIKKRMPEIIEGIKDKFFEFVDDMKNMGANLVEGIWNGILEAKDWIVEKVSGWCDDLWGTFTEFFGIHSPSRLMRDTIGNNLALGIGEGFIDTMSDVTDEMTDSLPTSFDVSPELNANIPRANDSRLQVAQNPIFSELSGFLGKGSNDTSVNFTLNIENFNNTNGNSMNELTNTIETTLYDLIYRKKVVY